MSGGLFIVSLCLARGGFNVIENSDPAVNRPLPNRPIFSAHCSLLCIVITQTATANYWQLNYLYFLKNPFCQFF